MLRFMVSSLALSLQFYQRHFVRCVLPAALWISFAAVVVRLLNQINNWLGGSTIPWVSLTYVGEALNPILDARLHFPSQLSVVAPFAKLLLIPALLWAIKRISSAILARPPSWSPPRTVYALLLAYGVHLVGGVSANGLLSLLFFKYYFKNDSYTAQLVQSWNSCLVVGLYLCWLTILVQHWMEAPAATPRPAALQAHGTLLVRVAIVLSTASALFVSGLIIDTITLQLFPLGSPLVEVVAAVAFGLTVLLLLPWPVLWLAVLHKEPHPMPVSSRAGA